MDIEPLNAAGADKAVHPRAEWAEAARELVDRGDGGLLDDPVPTLFDESEWAWE